ncbi:MAG: hypothetical protein OJF50_006510 [Nitrospira sp.]|nr:hypothetical protein [Nitrospira sp.]
MHDPYDPVKTFFAQRDTPFPLQPRLPNLREQKPQLHFIKKDLA